MQARKGILSLAVLCAALAAGCTPSPGEGGPTPGGLAEREWTPQAEPAEIAQWAAEGCRGGDATARQQCLEKALLSVIGPAGVDKAMAALGVLAGADADVQREGHVFAHGIGIAAYRDAATVSQTFAKCTADFQSGCYHGVIQAYFADRQGGAGGVTAEKLNALCAAYRTPDQRWVHFQCAHGMGHGLMAVYDHHLLRSLDACDMLSDAREAAGCYGGAFMENVVNATNPHHTTVTQPAGGEASGGGHEGHAAAGGAHAGHDSASAEHAGHQMAGAEHAAHGNAEGQPAGEEHAGHHAQAGGHGDHHAAADVRPAGDQVQGDGKVHSLAGQPFEALSDTDPLYPCTVVEEHHRYTCYQMQTSAILTRNDGDFAEAARLCQTAPADMVRVCFTSLGRDANAWGRGEASRVVELCDASPEEQRPWCIVGAVKNVVDVTAQARDGFAFCRVLRSGGSKNSCYRAVGEHVTLLHVDLAERARVCAAAEYAYVNECRVGANLPLEQHVREGDRG
jgi:hypothetical protein